MKKMAELYTTEMPTVDIKKMIVETAIRHQLGVIEDFRQRIATILANDGDANEEEYDIHQQSFQSEILAEVNLLNEEMSFAQHQLDELKHISFYTENPIKVGFGSVVRTNRMNFFVSVSMEAFRVENLVLLGISVNSPLYKSMKGRKVGDSFSCDGVTYLIQGLL